MTLKSASIRIESLPDEEVANMDGVGRIREYKLNWFSLCSLSFPPTPSQSMLRTVCTRSSRSILALRGLPSVAGSYRTLASVSRPSIPPSSFSSSRQLSTSISVMAPSDNNNNDKKRPRESNEKDEHDKEHESKDDWKKQPPYAPEDPNKPKKAVFKGNCHCHDVTFDIYVDKPKGAHFCQCVPLFSPSILCRC